MARPRKGLQAVIVAAIFLVSATFTQANLVENGDFEKYPGTSISPWTVNNDHVQDWQDEDNPARNWLVTLHEDPVYGSQGYTFTTLSQELNETEGGEMELSFDLRLMFDDVAWPPETDRFRVSLGSQTPYEIDTDMPEVSAQIAENGYFADHPVLTVSVDAGTPTLVFCLEGEADDVWTAVEIDNVRLCVVPAPGALLLGATGLGYAGWRLKRRDIEHVNA